MRSRATTVEAYLAALPEDRRVAIAKVREVILKNLDRDIAEGMGCGMIGYSVPHSRYPAGYHCNPKQPLPFAGLASQKNHMSLYLMSVYSGCEGDGGAGDSAAAKWFKAAWTGAGKKLDMGKACIRFKTLDDVPLEVVGEAIRRTPATLYIQRYEEVLRRIGRLPRGTKAAQKGDDSDVNRMNSSKRGAAKKAAAKNTGPRKAAVKKTVAGKSQKSAKGR
ncbi:hypothetical protein BH11PLA1_BH11PLA1_01720 [soil metagenome]